MASVAASAFESAASQPFSPETRVSNTKPLEAKEGRQEEFNVASGLCAHFLTMISGDEEDEVSAAALAEHATEASDFINGLFKEFDADHDSILNPDEAQALFERVSQLLIRQAAKGSEAKAVTAHALKLLDKDLDEACREMAFFFVSLADKDHDGKISLQELHDLLEGNFGFIRSSHDTPGPADQRPRVLDLLELQGVMQMHSRVERHMFCGVCLDDTQHQGCGCALGGPGMRPDLATDIEHLDPKHDAHIFLRWKSPTYAKDYLSIMGLGRSADATAYFLPEWGVVLDAGLYSKVVTPGAVLLSHGHRDHSQALPTLARPPDFKQGGLAGPVFVVLPKKLVGLTRDFLWKESVMNYGQEQTLEENMAFQPLDLNGVAGGDVIEIPKRVSKMGLFVEVFDAIHKVPAVAFGLFKKKRTLKPEYAAPEMKRKLKELSKQGVDIMMEVEDRILFYSGDTSIELLEQHSEKIMQYTYVLHECTFMGLNSEELDTFAKARGHTHYAQLHRYIKANPTTTFILCHWSIKYTLQEIQNFFKESYGGVPNNVVLWVEDAARTD